MIGIALNITGLIVGTIAALLMFFYPHRGQMFGAGGEAYVTWINSKDGANAKVGKRQIFLSKLAPWLLALAFLLQLLGVIVSLWGK